MWFLWAKSYTTDKTMHERAQTTLVQVSPRYSRFENHTIYRILHWFSDKNRQLLFIQVLVFILILKPPEWGGSLDMQRYIPEKLIIFKSLRRNWKNSLWSSQGKGPAKGAKPKDFCPSAIMDLSPFSLVYSITPDQDLCQLKGTLIANLISYNWISISIVNSQLRNFLIHVYIAG